MKDCESSYSSWKFSGGFRTWVKMSLVKTKEEDGSETVEFKQEVKKKKIPRKNFLGPLSLLRPSYFHVFNDNWPTQPVLGANSNMSWKKGGWVG